MLSDSFTFSVACGPPTRAVQVPWPRRRRPRGPRLARAEAISMRIRQAPVSSFDLVAVPCPSTLVKASVAVDDKAHVSEVFP
jgi:hypothetical protein